MGVQVLERIEPKKKQRGKKTSFSLVGPLLFPSQHAATAMLVTDFPRARPVDSLQQQSCFIQSASKSALLSEHLVCHICIGVCRGQKVWGRPVREDASQSLEVESSYCDRQVQRAALGKRFMFQIHRPNEL